MATKKKLLQAAAGSAGAGGPLDVEDVFSTYLYDGNGYIETITNDIDLSGEGGLVWIKQRTQLFDHALYDTERGTLERLSSNLSDAEANDTGGLTAFNSDGFTVGGSNTVNYYDGSGHVSWTWRKAPGFFDVVTYTGNGTAGRTVSHNLGSVPGCIIVKKTSAASNWMVYHRGANGGTNPQNYYAKLNDSDAFSSLASAWNNTAPTSSVFTLGDQNNVNQNGETYVAYLFAHNNSDGTFGANEDLDIIKCGSFVASGETLVDLGWEAQWVLIKYASGTGQNWFIHDSTRGWTVEPEGQFTLEPNNSDSEDLGKDTGSDHRGFRANNLTNGGTYVYMAIRKGTRIPEDATKVFDTLTWTGDGTYDREIGPNSIDGLYDAAINQRRNGTSDVRLHYRKSRYSTTNVLVHLNTQQNVAESDNSGWQWPRKSNYLKIRPSGDTNYNNISGNTYVANIWKQARGFFDVVAYSGNSTNGNAINHNLGVAPEMMWVKRRDQSGDDWYVYHKDLGANNYLNLNGTGGANNGATFPWNATHPTDSVFYLHADATVNSAAGDYMAFLFASLDGVSKIGSYSGNGTNGRVIDCGFTSGARYVLIKSVNAAGAWVYWDAERGIVSGNDGSLQLNSNAAEYSSSDDIDPDSSGFIINNEPVSGYNINESGTSFIFYAIA